MIYSIRLKIISIKIFTTLKWTIKNRNWHKGTISNKDGTHDIIYQDGKLEKGKCRSSEYSDYTGEFT